jgi:putative aminopeptidase FrvX
VISLVRSPYNLSATHAYALPPLGMRRKGAKKDPIVELRQPVAASRKNNYCTDYNLVCVVWEAAAEAQAKAREELIQRQASDAESANRMREEMRAQALGNKGVWR